MGSIKVTVFGRVKPCPKKLLNQEFHIENGEKEDFVAFGTNKTSSGKKYFSFHKVFDENASQEEIFEVVAKPVIEKVLHGFNGTIFTYGQTGSGKTYTMTGNIEKWTEPGLIPRTIQEVFKSKSEETVVSITYCEIYNEHVYDLIRVDRMDSDPPQVSLLLDSSGLTHFRNLSVHTTATAYEALELLVRGDANKMMAETANNAKSSRSHVVFSICFHIPHPSEDNICLKPVLYLVDLAGSEKLSKCKTLGNPWETRYINLSLHYLEQVLVALRQPRRAHIPYRNSLMTALLRNSLGGNCITAMIATFSLTISDIEETIQTCRFAERVALIKNEVKLNQTADTEKELETLRKENEKLKAQLKLLGQEGLIRDLNEDEKKLCSQIVKNYIQNGNHLNLPLYDARKMAYCVSLMKDILTENEEKKSVETDDDLFKTLAKAAENHFQSEEPEALDTKEIKNTDKNWRRKRNPIDLPKVNITYKRWKSTENIADEENCVTNKVSVTEVKLTAPQSESAKPSQKLSENSSNKIESFQGNKSEEAFLLAGRFPQEKNSKIQSNCDCSNGLYCTDEVEAKHIDTVHSNSSQVKNADSVYYLTIRDGVEPSEKIPFATLKKLISVGVQMEGKDYEREIVFHDSPSSDGQSAASEEGSMFSPGRMPLTGDQEVDEEILKFYRTRYEMFKNEQ